jgi:hypothetical protein
MTRLLTGTFRALIVFIIVAQVQGCGVFEKKPVQLEQKEDRPNTFRLVRPKSLIPFGEKDYIVGLSVFQIVPAEPEGTKVYWRLNAPRPVRAQGFEVVIGEVPDGFEQLIPTQGKVFTPVPGLEYYLAVAVKRDSETKWETLSWVAAKPFF